MNFQLQNAMKVRKKDLTAAAQTQSAFSDWVLPVWLQKQQNPDLPTYDIGQPAFVNRVCRSWVELRSRSGSPVRIDRFGVIDLAEPGWSLEIWLAAGEKLWTPGQFESVSQRSGLDSLWFETQAFYETGSCRMRVSPVAELQGAAFRLEVELLQAQSDLQRLGVYFVLRPYNNDGFHPIHRLSYQQSWATVNGRKLLYFTNEPGICCAGDARLGDVQRRLRVGEGTQGFNSADGTATALYGFSGLYAEFGKISLLLWPKPPQPKTERRLASGAIAIPPAATGRNRNTAPKIITGTVFDQIYNVNCNYLDHGLQTGQAGADSSLLLLLNRLGYYNVSRRILEKMLRKVRWDGTLAGTDCRNHQLLFLAIDYFHFSGDRSFAERYWPVWRRIAAGIRSNFQLDRMAQPDLRLMTGRTVSGAQLEGLLWSYAALKSLSGVCGLLGRNQEQNQYQSDCLRLWEMLNQSLYDSNENWRSSGRRALGIINSLFPLQIWEADQPRLREILEYASEHWLYQGGFFIPSEFSGIDPEATAFLATVLAQAGMDYAVLWQFLIRSGSPVWVWPDRVQPRTLEGIGQTGHRFAVGVAVLLLLRMILVTEFQDSLRLLPGVLTSPCWDEAVLRLVNLDTAFGSISLRSSQMGGILQLEYHANYHRRPAKVEFELGTRYRFLEVDRGTPEFTGTRIAIDPEFKMLRLRRLTYAACLDNTFTDTI